MKHLFILALTASVMLMSACSSLTVTADYDKTLDFTQFKTFSYYGWAENSDRILTPFDKERIEKAFGAEFRSRGLEYKEKDGDLVVVLFIVTEQKEQTTATTTGTGMYGGYYGYGPGWGWGGGMSTTTYNTYEYTTGTLVCDVFDAKAKKLIWEGVGSGTVDDNPQSRERGIPKSVAAIMAKYPVPKSK